MNRDLLSLYKNSIRIVIGWYIFFSYILIPSIKVFRADKPALSWGYFDTQIIVGLLLFVILFGSKVQLLDGLRKYSLILNNKSSTSIYVGRTYYVMRNVQIFVSFIFMTIFTLFILPYTLIYTLYLSVKKQPLM